MFNKLYKKYMFTLLPIIIIITLVFFSIALIFYVRILSDDYSQKETDFNTQQAENYCENLSLTSQCVNMFFEKYNFNTNNVRNNYAMTMALKKIKYSNIDIRSVFLKSSDQIYSLSPYDLEVGNFLIKQHPEIFQSSNDTPLWYYLATDNKENDSLLCIKTVSGGENVLCVTINLNNTPYSDSESKSELTFANNYYTLIPDKSSIIIMSGTDLSPSEIQLNRRNTETIHLNGFPFSLQFFKTTKPLNTMFTYLFIALGIMCAIIIIISYFLLKRFLNSTITALSVLHSEFLSFKQSLNSSTYEEDKNE